MTKNINSNIKDVCLHIDNNLGDNFSLEMLSKVACLSKYHFGRLFHAQIGITLFQYIQQQRIKKSAHQLYYYRNLKLTDIAYEAGFSNTESFTRAFKKMLSVPPTAFKTSPDWETLEKLIQNQLTHEKLTSLKSSMNKKTHSNEDKNNILNNRFNDLNIKIEWFDKAILAVLQHRGSPAQLHVSIQKFIAWRIENHTPPSVSKTYNIIYDDPSTTQPEDYRFDIGAEMHTDVVNNDYGVIRMEIPEGFCAVLQYKGSDEQLGSFINVLYSQWLPKSGKTLREFPCFIQRVKMYPTVPEHEAITIIYLPIEE